MFQQTRPHSLEETEQGDLWISHHAQYRSAGTVGGGTSLPAQSACLEAIAVVVFPPGQNAQKLAMKPAVTLWSSLVTLAANTLVSAHMIHNRNQPVTAAPKKWQSLLTTTNDERLKAQIPHPVQIVSYGYHSIHSFYIHHTHLNNIQYLQLVYENLVYR
jgi:hydroxymethylglutaryl-CoA reductase (NADPH)